MADVARLDGERLRVDLHQLVQHDTRKTGLYAREGVREAWVVVLREGLDGASIRVFTDPTPDGYRQVRALRSGDLLEPSTFECEPIPVSEVLDAPQPYLDPSNP